MRLSRPARRGQVLPAVLVLAILAGGASRLAGVCGVFTDVAADAFCPFVLEVFYVGITTGTTATTYDPSASVSRLQMAAFLSRTVDGVLKRGSRRAALNRFWTLRNVTSLGVTTLGGYPQSAACDGTDVWVSNSTSGTVQRVRGSDGKLLDTWTGMSQPFGLLSAMSKIFVGNVSNPGSLYLIDPALPAGAATLLTSSLPNSPFGLAFDGSKIFAVSGAVPSVSLVTPGTWTVTTVTTGFSNPFGILYDGANVWVTEPFGSVKKLDANAAVLQTVTVGSFPMNPVFDGGNLWVPNFNDATVSVVRASNGAVLATLTGNGLDHPSHASFDGERVAVTNQVGGSVSLWKAADFSALGSLAVGSQAHGVCSDGISFWIAASGDAKLIRY